MESIKCPNCDNDRFEMHVYCNLNLHTEALKQSSKGDKNSIEYLSLNNVAPQMAYSCSKCGYTIESLTDLHILGITVYVVGNSISKQRQGLNYIASIGPTGHKLHYNKIMDMLQDIGYVQLVVIKENLWVKDSWVFTKAAWQKAQADPNFRLSDSQYTVNIKDLS